MPIQPRKFLSENDLSSSITAMTGSAVNVLNKDGLFHDASKGSIFSALLLVDSAVAITAIEFHASKLPDGSNPIVVKAEDLTGRVTTAIGDYLTIELRADEIMQAVVSQNVLTSGISEYKYFAPVVTAPISNLITTVVASCLFAKNSDNSPDRIT